MKLISFLTDNEVLQEFDNNFSDWYLRVAVRAVVYNSENKIALMNLQKRDLYKLPGGGVEENEDLEKALKRELLEETGCSVKINNNLGVFLEERNTKMFQISYCYTAIVLAEGSPEFTKNEIENGFVLEWHTLEEAILTMQKLNPEDYGEKFMVKRDLKILLAAKEVL